MIRTCLLLWAICACIAANCQKTSTVDSLARLLKSAKEDTNKVILLDKISYKLHKGNPKQGINYAQQALSLAEKLEWTRGQALAYCELGINASSLSDFNNALIYYNKALGHYQELGDQHAQSAVFANMSLVHQAQGAYPQALQYAFKALGLKETLGEEEGMGVIHENIGTIFLEQRDYEKTIKYYLKALEQYKKSGDIEGMARDLGNMGIVKDAMGNYKDALAYHTQALQINKKLKSKYSMQINEANVSLAYLHLNNFGQALLYQREALRISKELDNPSGIAINLGNLGELFFTIYDSSQTTSRSLYYLDSAIRYLEQAVSLCKELNFSGPLIEYQEFLSRAYYIARMYEKAFLTLKAYTALHDSVFSLQNKLTLERLDASHELQLRDRQLEINRLKLKQKDNELIIYIISIILLLLLVGMSVWLIARYRRSNTVLQKEKERNLKKIEEQITHIKKQANILEEIAHTQSHDVRGPVATILGLVQLFNQEDYADPANKVIIDGIVQITQMLDIAVQKVIEKKNTFA